MFHRIGPAAYKADLSNTHRLMDLLGHPENAFKSIHVAGTNGKGSTSHMLAAILQESGYKTGLYTSPHLLDFRERIRINGEMISREAVQDFVVKHRADFDAVAPSFFEWTVALAFDHFRREAVDIAVIETGLGGRLDSTNVITPLVSVITNIGWDHASLLGDTLEKIAGEKAGIIKSDIPVIVGERNEATSHVFSKKATSVSAPITFASDVFQVECIRRECDRQLLRVLSSGRPTGLEVELDLPAAYQQKNVATVLAAVNELSKAGWSISDASVKRALSGVRPRTGLMGRWQKLSDTPLTLCDVGHNEDGIREVVSQLKATSFRKLHFVLGMVKDKDVHSVLRLLPVDAVYYFSQPGLPRALPVHELAEAAVGCGIRGAAFQTVRDAVEAARHAAGEDDLVFIGGSTFVVAEAVGLFV
ncbi:MAG: hypothetical protein RL021_2103 [Bacteroidota bacterium]